MTQISRMPGSL